MDRLRGRAWLVVPAMGIVAGALAFALSARADLVSAIAIGSVGVALAHAVRALCGESPGASVGAVLAACVGAVAVVGVPGLAGGELVRAALAAAVGVWTLAEIATAVSTTPRRHSAALTAGRGSRPSMIELTALAGAVVAGLLDPTFTPLIVLAGARLVMGRPRRRWGVGVVGAGALVVLAAVIAGLAHGGAWASLWSVWSGAAARPIAPWAFAARVGDALGPIAAVAAIAGVIAIALHGRWAAIAIAAVCALAMFVGQRGGGVGAALVTIAALAGGIAIARLATTVRMPVGQVAVGALAGFILLVPLAWTVGFDRPRDPARDAHAHPAKVAAWTSSAVIVMPRRGPVRRSRSATSMAFTSAIARSSRAPSITRHRLAHARSR